MRAERARVACPRNVQADNALPTCIAVYPANPSRTGLLGAIPPWGQVVVLQCFVSLGYQVRKGGRTSHVRVCSTLIFMPRVPRLQMLVADYVLLRPLSLAIANFFFLSSRCAREVAVVGQGEQYCQVRPGSAPGLAHGFRPPHIPLCPLSDGRHCQPRGLVHAADDAARKGGAAAAALLHGVQRLAVGERSASVCCASEHALSRPLRVPLCLPHCWRLTAARRSVCRCCCRGC